MEPYDKENFQIDERDRLIRNLNKIVGLCVRVLAILMVFVIIFGLVAVVVTLYRHANFNDVHAFSIDRYISTLGSFLAVLVAIEIFTNIVFYLKKDAIHVPLVLATALTAVARSVIIMDYAAAEPFHLLATSTVILAVGITFWLVTKKSVEEIK